MSPTLETVRYQAALTMYFQGRDAFSEDEDGAYLEDLNQLWDRLPTVDREALLTVRWEPYY